MKRLLSACLAVFAACASAGAQVTNFYHFNRVFTPALYTNTGENLSAYKIVLAAKELTGIVGPTNICIRSNETYATEYEGFGWGYESAVAAWTSALAIYPAYHTNYPAMTYDNAGWIKGTRPAYGTWGSFIWMLQNTISFTSSPQSYWVSPSGASNAVASVLVGTLGDYCPRTIVTEVGPVFDTNYLGTGVATDQVFKADLNAYYKLIPFRYLAVNNDDSDRDGIPDFADGYNLSPTNSLDERSTNDFFAIWRVQLASNINPSVATIMIGYDASDPAGVSVGGAGYVPATGSLRLWKKQAADKTRTIADYIAPGTYEAADLGFNATDRIIELYIEPINPVANQSAFIQVSPDGSPSNFRCLDWLRMTVIMVDLDISNGQDGPLLNDDKEETPGAFSVANLNDTDGDGTVDKDDGEITGEEDLMQIVLRKPEPDLGGMVQLTVPAMVKLWKNATKSAGEETAVQFNTADLPKTNWVELRAQSCTLRDIEIVLEYKGCEDKVKATGLWAEKSGFRNELSDSLWTDAGDPLRSTFFGLYGGKFGIQYSTPPVNVQYAMGMEFTTYPSGIVSDASVAFDVTRQVDGKEWDIDGTVVAEGLSRTWPTIDTANDDVGPTDEDSIPENDHIYSIDGPGFVNAGAHDQKVWRFNFKEFVRVRLDGTAPSGNSSDGSRCSDKANWHIAIWAEKDGTQYRQRAGKANEVEEDHISVLPPPSP